MRILFVCEQCNPDQPSVPLLGYHFYRTLRERVDITLVTHGRNEEILRRHFPQDTIEFIRESKVSTKYFKLFQPAPWALKHIFNYPLYEEFNRKVAYRLAPEIHKFDLVHAFTPIIPRYPYALSKYLGNKPFLIGPVNGGLPFPQGYDDIAKAEGAQYNFIKKLNFLLPGYRYTYERANKVLVGSNHTLNELKGLFPRTPYSYFAENGIDDAFFYDKQTNGKTILFVGRLTPYKGADILIEAIRDIPDARLLIAGDGPDKQNLQKLIEKWNLSARVELVGFKKPNEMPDLYKNAQIFAFPSIREFGGAVVLEAMAASLPCVITNYGGIAEYLPDNAGFKIDLKPRPLFVNDLKEKLTYLLNNPQQAQEMGQKGHLAAQNYRWDKKADILVRLYRDLLI